MKNGNVDNLQSVNQCDRLMPCIIYASLFVLFALITIFIPTRAVGQGVWTSRDINAPPTPGSSVLNGNNVIVSGSGNLWGTSDACQYYYQPLNGDGQIIAHLQSVANQPSESGKAGLMIRQSLDANSQQVSLLMQGTYGPAFIERTTTGGSDTQLVWNQGSTPAWYKLVRSGSTITASISPDGVTWNPLPSTTLSFSTHVFIGLVVGGYVGNDPTVATFSNVAVTENDLQDQYGVISFDNNAGNVVSIGQPGGNLAFNNFFKEPNSSYTGAHWSGATGGLNLSGCVQSGNRTGYVFYDTSVTPGTGVSPGSGGMGVNTFQTCNLMLSFSLNSYASTANEVGVFFRVNSSGNNGYVIIAKPVQSGSNYVFQYTLWTTSNYAPYGTGTGGSMPLATYTSTIAIPSTPSQFYTLSVNVGATSAYTAQIYDATGTSVGEKATFSNSTNQNAGMVGFLVSGTTSAAGATAYQFGISNASTPADAPQIKYVQAGVSGTGTGTFAAPYSSINYAVGSVATAGVIVQVASGTYNEMVYVGHSNVTIRAQHALGAILKTPGNDDGFAIGGSSVVVSHVTIDGFEVTSATAGSTGGGVTSNYGANHLIVRNCYIHDCGGSGIGLGNGDYRIVYNNVVARNAFYNIGSDSGLSFWGLCQADDNPGYHSMICNNVFYGNNNNFAGATDGEGIIIDDNRNTQTRHSAGADPNGVAAAPNYTGAYTLIENNLVFNNGGRGIECYLSNNIDIVNNTCFENNTGNSGGALRAEIEASGTNNVTCVNNIACTTTATNINLNNTSNTPFAAGGGTTTSNYGSNFAYFNNIAYDANNPNTTPVKISGVVGEQPVYSATNGNITGKNPGFLNAIGNSSLQNINLPYMTDFRSYLGLSSTSIAINSATDGFTDGADAVTPAPKIDLDDAVRPSGGGYDCGAYQYTPNP